MAGTPSRRKCKQICLAMIRTADFGAWWWWKWSVWHNDNDWWLRQWLIWNDGSDYWECLLGKGAPQNVRQGNQFQKSLFSSVWILCELK